MNINDINERFKRIYISIDERYDKNIVDHMNVQIDQNTRQLLALKFDKKGKTDIEQKVISIIHTIASLKDHLKNKFGKKLVEDEINKSKYLQIIIDIDNSDKHGYPAKIRPRSGLFPYIKNIERTLVFNKGDKVSYVIENKIEPSQTGSGYESKNWIKSLKINGGQIKIIADIFDSNNKKITDFETLVIECLNIWENIIISK
jgi:hypothetical protein